MFLSDIQLKTDYNKVTDDIAEAFYLPCMRAACRYDRISGYFASTIFVIAWEALKQFVDNGGHMRLICSPFLSDEDRIALEHGYSKKSRKDIITRAIQSEVEKLFASQSLTTPSTVLAYLVAHDIIDVKIAVPISEKTPVNRLFHDKVGVFYDSQENAVGFRGPMNETFKGLASDGNIESIDVFPSWEDSRDQQRLRNAQHYFSDLWAGAISDIEIYEFPAASREILKCKSRFVDWRTLTDEIAESIVVAKRWSADKSPGAKKPRTHQIDALEAWVKNGRRGIFEHATGSGKTYTAICAIRNALELGEVVLLCVPSRELLGQWAREIKENLGDFKFLCLLCGDGYVDWKKAGTLSRWTSPTSKKRRVIITTLSTCAMPGFLENMIPGDHVFCVADEVHRTGSAAFRKLFTFDTGPRLGLSATPYRYGDPEGTTALLDYFGGIIPPPFTLKDAIAADVLTRYFYYPQLVSLSESEQEAWDEKTVKIRRAIAIASRNGAVDKSDMLKEPNLRRLLIARARIVKEAGAKVDLALRVLQSNYHRGQRWLVYCDNQQQLSKVLKLLLEYNFDAYEYHSEMEGDRENTLKYFTQNGGVLVSIKCLDEGVDIPVATHALILASSQNPREFIQRRGRILRKSPGKYYAYLYDAITMPFRSRDNDVLGSSIIETELARAIEFGRWAENPTCISTLQNLAVDFGINPVTLCKEGVENE